MGGSGAGLRSPGALSGMAVRPVLDAVTGALIPVTSLTFSPTMVAGVAGEVVGVSVATGGQDRSAVRPGPVSVRAVRHGQSVANLAFAEAAARGHPDAGVDGPDRTVPLSDLGVWQARRLGLRLAADPMDPPDLVFSSPFVRARQTTRIALSEAGLAGAVPVRVDERLGDRRMGELELLTPAAIAAWHPHEQVRMLRSGPMRYRPPGGESLGDVADRIRSFWRDLQVEAGQRVLLVGHDATVLMMRALTEDMNEPDIVRVMAEDPVGNATVTTWTSTPGGLRMSTYNDGGHLAG